MSTRDTLKIIIGGIGSLLAVGLYNYFTAANVPPLASAIFGGGATVLFVSLAPRWCLDQPLRWRWSRRRLHPHARYEGYWFIEVTGVPEGRRYAIGAFSYDPKKDRHKFDGWATDLESWVVSAKWWSQSLAFDLEHNAATYTYESVVLASSGLSDEVAPDDASAGSMVGYGKIKFETERNVVCRGEGSFTDNVGVRPIATKYQLKRISSYHMSRAGWDSAEGSKKDFYAKLLELADYMRRHLSPDCLDVPDDGEKAVAAL